MKSIHTVLLLGSGALRIGEAGEFDYSGTQAIKALKEEGVRVILINPNIATVQTSAQMADEVYFLPVTPEVVTDVIRREKPDGILLSFGGQTALNCGLALHEQKILTKHNVRVLGTPISAIVETEDRKLFAAKLRSLGLSPAKGQIVRTLSEAKRVARRLGYPVMIRAGFALGGAGSGVVRNEQELEDLASRGLATSQQLIVEESLNGWKEIEYEVVRDSADNCITVCNMENFDPVGIHTGESIVVAPSQTLTNDEYYTLRAKSIDVIRSLGIVGECNIQFALHPTKDEVRVIEVNARLSRSSALASKATGYPLAYVAAKLAMGKHLPDIKNAITRETTAFFEPALDYVVVKIPRWDLDKFTHVSPYLGSEMKSVGEVMSIARSFEEAIQKATRMLNDGYAGVIDVPYMNLRKSELLAKLRTPTVDRLFIICSALAVGVTVKKIASVTGIDPWFVHKLAAIVGVAHELAKVRIPDRILLRRAKEHGFSDDQISHFTGARSSTIRSRRKRLGIAPVVKRIDTMAGEFPARTNYLYMTYHGTESDHVPQADNRIMVLGCGPYSIGTSVEFDWCAVNVVSGLRRKGVHSVMVNCNPETVSTDFDMSDTLYFEEMTKERVLDICDVEACPVVVSVGGQIPNNLAPHLSAAGIDVLGTAPKSISRAEDRQTFSALLDKLKIPQPGWKQVASKTQALRLANRLGFPLLVRPSFVLSGKGMSIIDTRQELIQYLSVFPETFAANPLVISQFLSGAIEVDVDGVAQNGRIVRLGLLQHVEGGGVHSGDSVMTFPPYTLHDDVMDVIKEYTGKIANVLAVSGPFNIQFLIRHNQPYVIECNLRASRSMPLVSKASGVNYMDAVCDVLTGKSQVAHRAVHSDHFTVKVPQFSFHKLRGADPVLRVEMSSTGEVASMGKEVHEAYLKAILSTGVRYPTRRAAFVSLGGARAKSSFADHCRMLVDHGYTLYATAGTHLFLKEYDIRSRKVAKMFEGSGATAYDLMKQGKIDFLVVIPEKQTDHRTYAAYRKTLSDGYAMRRYATDRGLPLFSAVSSAKFFVESVCRYTPADLELLPWSAYK